jgi:subtilase family serine protease
LFWSAALALAATPLCALAQTVGDRLAEPMDETQLVTLTGNVHPLARNEFDHGLVSGETKLERMVLELEPAAGQQAELDALVEAQQDAESPLFHQWLTSAEYGERFGVSADDLARVCDWLTGHGFEVEEIAASRRLVIFSGTAGQVAQAFHTSIHHYVADGVQHIANSQDPQIPAALAGVVGGVISLHDFRHKPQIDARAAARARPQYTAGSTHYLFPGDFAAIYDLNSLYSAGTTGAGIGIAIVGRSNINLSDVAAFRATAGLPANTPAVILAGPDPGLVAADEDESTLGVEWSGAVAPAASVSLVVAASTATTDAVDLAAQYAVNHATAPIVSVSYWSCEREMGAAELRFYNALWQQAAAEGISVLVSSGDSGASGCSAATETVGSGLAVNGMCSSPYATCVGGTEFNEGTNAGEYWSQSNSASYESALGYIPEVVWNESRLNGGTGLWASAGGVSEVYAQPPWQVGVSGTSEAKGMRAVPDVALTAADHDGYFVWAGGTFFPMRGTSAATPSFAGVMALVVQAKGGTGQGNVNAELYALAGEQRSPFHATPSGSNSVPGVTGFTAGGAAYNLATGLGSVDAAVLVSEWGTGAVQKPTPSLTLTAGATEVSVAEGGIGTVSFTAATGGSFTGNISFQVSGLPAGVTAAWTANPIQAVSGVSAKTTLMLSAGAGARAEAATVVITAAGDSLTASQSVTLQVDPMATPRGGPVGLPCSLCDRPRPLSTR